MAEIVTMPKLGFDMAEGTLVRWVIAEGEPVSKGAVLAEIETDKATVEVESNFEGVVARHLIDEGTPVPVGDPIAVVGAEGEEIDFQALLGAEGAEKKPEKETAPEAEAVAAPAAQVEEAAQPEPAEEGAHLPGGVRASPVARRIADEKGVDLRQVKGSGPQGRIGKKDVETYLERLTAAPPAATAAAPPAVVAEAAPTAAVAAPVFSSLGPAPEDKHLKVSRLRAIVGRRMLESKTQVPHFYVTHEYDVAGVLEMRKDINALLPEGEKLTVNDFVIKAVALNLRQFPNLNAALKGDEVVQYGHVNIGVAVAVEGGLLTVVCKDADRKPLRQISLEVRGMAARARDGKVRPDDIEGSTFSISNMGMYDVENFAAIINPPEAAILAVGSARQVPVVVDGELKPGMRMKATISIDHRVSDGAEGAKFLQALEAYFKEPLRLML